MLQGRWILRVTNVHIILERVTAASHQAANGNTHEPAFIPISDLNGPYLVAPGFFGILVQISTRYPSTCAHSVPRER